MTNNNKSEQITTLTVEFTEDQYAIVSAYAESVHLTIEQALESSVHNLLLAGPTALQLPEKTLLKSDGTFEKLAWGGGRLFSPEFLAENLAEVMNRIKDGSPILISDPADETKDTVLVSINDYSNLYNKLKKYQDNLSN
ncbi:hypothetical protein EQG49_11955 [Periweissella cryptocerci]|uniref:Uncharacterized protein n=1 Tax=Periweissella cryptocerci TaxID=2506420 RepID=A0A4P6YWI6_9LACO|nr:hypothetical protein [Periweissella cryptocerci]QBO37117.1 hypothetical protein EQG49_11955 [Periweissella cryptocerci]